MGHLQPGAGRPLFQCREKVNYTPQAVGPGGNRAAVGTIQQQGVVGMRRVKREMREGDGNMEGSKRERRMKMAFYGRRSKCDSVENGRQ